MLNLIFSTDSIIFAIIWQSSLFIIIGLLASYLWKRNPTRAHHILFLSITAFITVPIITVAVKHLNLGILKNKPAPVVEYEYIDMNDVVVQSYEIDATSFGTSIPIELKKTVLPWTKIFIYTWILLSFILLARLIFAFFIGIYLINKSRPFKSPVVTEAINLATSKIGINKNIAINISKSVSCPVIWCWKHNPILLLPYDPKILNNKIDLTGIFCHELAHLKRYDYIIGLLLDIMIALLPWHPLLWLAKKRLLDLSEHACDDCAVAVVDCKLDYAESLVNLVPTKIMAFIPTATRNNSFLKKRVMHILTGRYKNPSLSKKWILSTVSIASCIILTTALAQTRSENSDVVDLNPQSNIILEPIDIESSITPNIPEEKKLSQNDFTPFEKLDLPEEDIRNLEALLSDYRAKVSEGFQSLADLSLPEAEINENKQLLLEQQIDEFREKAVNLLGIENYQIYNDYWMRFRERDLVTQFSISLSENESLSDKKEQELIDAMYQARKDMEKNYNIEFFKITPTSFFINKKLSEKRTMFFELFDRYIESAWSVLSISQAVQFENKINEIEEKQRLAEM